MGGLQHGGWGWALSRLWRGYWGRRTPGPRMSLCYAVLPRATPDDDGRGSGALSRAARSAEPNAQPS